MNNAVFLNASDELGKHINQKANELFAALHQLNAHSFEQADEYTNYFLQHHLGNRLFFSIQNSAHIIYQSVLLTGQPISQLNAIDYGAGLGTLFMLGGMLGFKRFDYNDHLPQWHVTAKNICKKIGINIQAYIPGDINAVADFAAQQNFRYNMILSRNVIEHIYSLPEFYTVLQHHNPQAVVYSTTTANYHNPAMRWYHRYIHKKVEKIYLQQRINQIQKMLPALPAQQVLPIAKLTRGKGQQDFLTAVQAAAAGIPITLPAGLATNTCDYEYGVWCEHLLTQQQYRSIISSAGFKMQYTAGYWDTHYSNPLFNIAASFFNTCIGILGKKKGVLLSPFVNVIALPQ
ncbi:MAG: hypothetical protein RL172_1402 [Bacteroidota bacterium]|jgi:2-polyprenyl-3-methyl-5-hydroxy-6-metoxy-1,4-benzoquinol methylase